MVRDHDTAGTRLTSGFVTWLRHDLRVGLRVLRSTPRITCAAILSLALGTGTTTAIVSVLNGLLHRTLPIAEPERLGVLSTSLDDSRGQTPGWSAATWRELQRHESFFDGVSAFAGARFTTAVSGEPESADTLLVSGDYFPMLGVKPFLGRTITAADDVPGGGVDGPVAVASYNYWQRRLGGSPNAVGQRVTLDGVPFTIVGVTPPEFLGVEVGRSFDLAVALAIEPLVRGLDSLLSRPVDRWLMVLVRLKTGQSLDAATAALRSAQPSIREAALPPADFARLRQDFLQEPFTVVAAGQGTSALQLRQRYTRPLVILLILVGLVLLIVCANLANLQLARGSDRRHEFSVRVALGSSPWRLARQLLVESALLAAAGTILGALFGVWASRALVAQLSSSVNRVDLDLSVDGGMLTLVLVLTAATTLLFGVVPALRASRVAPIDALRLRLAGMFSGGGILSGWLVVAQIALCVVLVVGAGLFIRTLERLSNVPLGFDSDRVLVVDVDATQTGVVPGERVSLYGRLVDAVASTPGVEHAAAALVTPVSGGFFPLAVDEGGAGDVPTASRQVVGTFITPEWFASYDIPLHAGRDLEASDTTGAPLVAVVNDAFARAIFPERGALGQVVDISGGRGDIRLGRRTIVGVVGNSLFGTLREGVKPTVYFPFTQWNVPLPVPSRVSISVRSAVPSVRPSQMVRSAATALSASSTVNLRIRQIGDELRASLAQERVIATLAGFFGALALLLAALGLYGVTAHIVAQRRSELGVRLALGASPGSIAKLIVRGLMRLVVVGLSLGIGGGIALSQLVAGLLYGVEPQDTMTFAASAIVVAMVAAVAASVPVLRSCRLDPGRVLREI